MFTKVWSKPRQESSPSPYSFPQKYTTPSEVTSYQKSIRSQCLLFYGIFKEKPQKSKHDSKPRLISVIQTIAFNLRTIIVVHFLLGCSKEQLRTKENHSTWLSSASSQIIIPHGNLEEYSANLKQTAISIILIKNTVSLPNLLIEKQKLIQLLVTVSAVSQEWKDQISFFFSPSFFSWFLIKAQSLKTDKQSKLSSQTHEGLLLCKISFLIPALSATKKMRQSIRHEHQLYHFLKVTNKADPRLAFCFYGTTSLSQSHQHH